MAGSSAARDLFREICRAALALSAAAGRSAPDRPAARRPRAADHRRTRRRGPDVATRSGERSPSIRIEDVLRWGWMAHVASTLVWDFEALRRDLGPAAAARPRRRGACGASDSTSRSWVWRARGWATSRVPKSSSRRPTAWRRRLAARSRPTPRCGCGHCRAGKAKPPRDRRRTRPRPPKGKGWRRASPTGRPRSCTTASPATTRRRRRLGTPPRTPSFPIPAIWALPELVEAAARVGDTELAREALERLAADDAALRHRQRARHRGALPGAAQRRHGRRGAVSRGDRSAEPHAAASGARPRASALRRVAAPRESPGRRARAAAHGPRDAGRDRDGGVRGARTEGA